jgi:hypothetical protein
MPASAQLSKFQRIGFIRTLTLAALRNDPHATSFQQDQAIDHLRKAEHLDLEPAIIVTSPSSSLKDVFETVWNSLSDYDKAMAFWLNYRFSKNHWPYWDIYSQALLPHIRFPSGTPESIIGSPYQLLPDTWKEEDSFFKKCRSEQFHSSTKADDVMHVWDEHNFIEFSCRDNYFNRAQQVYIILNALDTMYDSQADHDAALEFLERLKLPTKAIHSLISENNWPNRFHMLWRCLNKQQKTDLITEDWTYYDSYWPGLEDYNQTLCPIIDLSFDQSKDDHLTNDAAP